MFLFDRRVHRPIARHSHSSLSSFSSRPTSISSPHRLMAATRSVTAAAIAFPITTKRALRQRRVKALFSSPSPYRLVEYLVRATPGADPRQGGISLVRPRDSSHHCSTPCWAFPSSGAIAVDPYIAPTSSSSISGCPTLSCRFRRRWSVAKIARRASAIAARAPPHVLPRSFFRWRCHVSRRSILLSR